MENNINSDINNKKKCIKCEKLIPKDYGFCTFCGTKQNNIVESKTNKTKK